MTTTINRRTALLGTVTLPAALAPLGLAEGANLPIRGAEPVFGTDANDDPFVPAFCRYVDAEIAYHRACKEAGRSESDEDEERANARCDAAADAMLEMSETVPTSTLGLYFAICALLPVFGELDRTDGDVFDFDSMNVRCHHTNGSGEALLRSLKEAAERILNNNQPEAV